MTRRRPAAALMLTLVALAIIAAMSAAIARQVIAQKQFLQRREHQLQADWLVRSGIEHAAARLLADGGYRGETLKLVPDSRTRIEVQPLPDDAFRVVSTARFPVEEPGVVERSAERTIRLRKDGTRVRVQIMSGS